ncbi:MAG: hypothetical protein HY749_16235 [Gammaproteobacteria bacterium]|nr:hypothetical protein [Gammaproteobacteria bacterium]
MTALTGKGDTFENAMLKLVLWNQAFGTLWAAGALGNLWCSLNYADPTEEGTAQSSEASYPSYARASLNRNAGSFTIVGNAANFAADVAFTRSTGAEPNGGGSLGFWTLTDAVSGASTALYGGPLSGAIPVGSTGIAPILTTGTVIREG